MAALSDAAAAFGVGVALGASPGPVQFVLLTEASRGGFRRGFRAMAGANGTFALLLVALAAGLSFLSPGPVAVRVLKVVGGGFLLFVAIGAVRDLREVEGEAPRSRLGPTPRGALAVVLNPGAWLFLATTGSAVVAAATRDGGKPLAFLTVAALMAGVAVIDGTMVVIGGGAAARLNGTAARAVRLVLVATLAAIGAWFLFQGVRA